MRSRAHIQRPSTNQILFKMKTANRILVSFTEDLTQSHSLTRKQLTNAPSSQPPPRPLEEDLRELVSQVQIADNVIKKSNKKQKQQVSSTTSETDEQIKPKVEASTTTTVTIKTPIVEKKKLPRISLGAVKKISIVSALKSDTAKQPTEPKTFREWALAEREKRFQALQQVSYQQIRQEREANEIFPRMKNTQKKFFDRSKKAKVAVEQKKKKDEKQQYLPGVEHLAGYLYGGFPRKDERMIDKTMENQTKFHVPLTMFARAEVESKVRAVCRKKVQSARLDYMKIPQIPSDSEDDDDNSNDIIEDSKRLSFVRTFNFRVPAVAFQKKKRSERIKSKYLKGNRLKRINMLLFDRKMSAEKNKQRYAVDENNIAEGKDKMRMGSIESQLMGRKESSPQPAVTQETNVIKTFESDYR